MGGPNFIKALENAFSLDIQGGRPVGGGNIASCYLLNTRQGWIFAKILDIPEGLQMLEAEKEGLEAISGTDSLKVPEILGCGPTTAGSCLLLEYIPPGSGSHASFVRLGRGLAKMHRVSASSFGWSRPNFIGSLPQKNPESRSWPAFYVQNRLVPQYEMARSRQLLSAWEIPEARHMEDRVSSFVPNVRPSLLHGDLWSGNYLISSDGSPYLIDPAAYYGHAEVDLAMSLLFGGFPREFYNAYFDVNPKEPGYDLRIKLYQLYYLLVHLNLFGRSYYASVNSIGTDLFGQ